MESRDLTESQTVTLDTVVDYFFKLKKHKDSCSGEPGNPLKTFDVKPPRILVTGKPGCGKSYVISTITEVASIMGLGHIATCSYNGIAAVNVDGSTICSLLSINDRTDTGKHWHLSDSNDIEELRCRLSHEDLCGLVVDEISTVDTRIIALLHHRLQQVMNNYSQPFGGVPIFFFGDFNQLGPVQKTFIPKDMMTWAVRNRINSSNRQFHEPPTRDPSQLPKPQRPSKAVWKQRCTKIFVKSKTAAEKKEEEEANRFKPGSLAYAGCLLLSEFKRYQLLEQTRSIDALHTAFVERLSDGEPITIDDIKLYDHLSKEDVAKDPEKWKFAPVLVSTNAERLNIVRMKAQMWAKQNDTYVFKWRTRLRKEVNRPSSETLESVRDENAFYWQYFVARAPSNLGHNINGQLALVNGAPLLCHSLTFADAADFERVQALLESNDAPPYGSEIIISEPAAVNMVVLPSLDDKPPSSHRKEQLDLLRKFSISEEEIVIPITASTTGDFGTFSYFTRDYLAPIATAEVRQPFPFDLAFSITVHKAQGRTLPQVVVDLNFHDTHYSRMEFAAVFVALSRVKSRADIRLLGHKRSADKICYESAYKHLTLLHPREEALAFLYGFSDAQGSTWDQERALSHTSSST